MSKKVRVFITTTYKEVNGERLSFEGPRIYAVDWPNAEFALKQVDPAASIEGVLLEEIEFKDYEQKI